MTNQHIGMFLKNHLTLKTGRMAAVNSTLPSHETITFTNSHFTL